jgi:site-specific DNA-methyltransferase (adenine-specific)
MPDAPNHLYYGDNLDILRRYVKDETVDLVYLDPPFNSSQDYNVLFAERDGSRSTAQFKAFGDTWQWGDIPSFTYRRVVEEGGQVSLALQAFRHLLGTNDMLAYLTMMAPRLVELRRVLKPTGSIYLHCDPTASHYLKLLMDAIFGPQQFFAEIVWQRWSAHGDARRYGAVHDVLLFYGKTQNATFNKQFVPYDKEYIRTRYKYSDPDGRR